MSRHINIPIFIPHLGCPNQCVFCNQRIISGRISFDESGVQREIEQALSTVGPDDECEIAFFGGSFTGIDRDLMIRLLEIGKGYIDRGMVKSLRCSTRPDYINDEILSILKEHGVKTVELGLQSCNDQVLKVTKRGHTSQAGALASRLVKEWGFELVGQMMIGLPGSSIDTELETARRLVEWGCDGARIYPTVVFKDTELADMLGGGEYTPLSIDDAVRRSAEVLYYLTSCGVRVIRIGLCSSENLSSDTTYLAGPNHPALGELVEGRIYYDRVREQTYKVTASGATASVSVPRGELSKAIGQKRCYKEMLIKEFGFKDIRYSESDALAPYEISFSYT